MSRTVKENVSALVIGDPHFRVDNVPEVDLFISRITKLAEEKNPDFIVILGDVLHTHERIHTIPLNKAYELIDKMRNISETFVLVGNHDATSNQIFLTDDHWMNGMKEWSNLTIVDKVVRHKVKEFEFVLVPYVPNGRFEEALNTNVSDLFHWKDATCIFAHQEFQGCKMGAIISTDGDKWNTDYPHIISGHIHSRQKPQENVYYCGSSMQNAFGESSKNIIPFVVFSTEIKDYSLTELDLELPQKKIVYMDVENVDDYVQPETDDKIKLTISGSYEQFKALKKTKKYKKLVEDGVKIVFKAKTMEGMTELLKNVSETNSIEEKMESLTISKKGKTGFIHILDDIILKKNDPYLTKTYEFVVKSM
jgi:DNA repair exonuclease SbcCD nuclease subunit